MLAVIIVVLIFIAIPVGIALLFLVGIPYYIKSKYPKYRVVEAIDGNGNQRWIVQRLDFYFYHNDSLCTSYEMADKVCKSKLVDYNSDKLYIVKKKRIEDKDWESYLKWKAEIEERERKILNDK